MTAAIKKKSATCVSIDLPLSIEQDYVREAMASILYYNGILSEKQARTMIGRTRREFQEEIIPKFGLSMIGGTAADAEIEMAACKRQW
ncbi:MAG: hypothetical protein AB7S75_04450 [Desulfococcaceae bacterium]